MTDVKRAMLRKHIEDMIKQAHERDIWDVSFVLMFDELKRLTKASDKDVQDMIDIYCSIGALRIPTKYPNGSGITRVDRLVYIALDFKLEDLPSRNENTSLLVQRLQKKAVNEDLMQ